MAFCKSCGKELDDNWVSCPYCQTRIEQSEANVEADVYVEESIVEPEEDKVFFKTLFQMHPIRFCLCILIWVYVICRILRAIRFTKVSLHPLRDLRMM